MPIDILAKKLLELDQKELENLLRAAKAVDEEVIEILRETLEEII